MTEFQPWTIQNGTLRLNPWPEHTGRVVMTVDVFEPFEGLIVTQDGFPAWRAAGQPGQYQAFPGKTDWVFYGEGYRPLTMQDILSDLFAHIDANPQATHHLRTLHPERVADEWGERFDPNCKACGGDGCDSEPWRASDLMAPSPCRKCFHRPNVAIAAGPIRTQAEADRLLPELLLLANLCREVYPVFRPVKRIDIGRWLKPDHWEEQVGEQEWIHRNDCPCCGTGHMPPRFFRIVVSGENNDYTRDLRSQAIDAGVAFAHNWESEVEA